MEKRTMSIENAHWVCAKTNAVPVMRKTITVKNPAGAVIDICGLGFFELYIDGKKVSGDFFAPSQTDYGFRDLSTLIYPIADSFRHRVYYRRYELASYLTPGENRMEILLGNGWYRQTERTAEGKLSYGNPCLIFALFVDGYEILSDETLEWRDSHIVFQNIFVGETQDFTHDGDAWQRVMPASAPDGMLLPDPSPADRILRRIRPTLIFSEDGRAVWDAGENLSGIVSFVMPAAAKGAETVVRHAELITREGALYPNSAGGEQIDRYIGDGTEKQCAPHFVWHGFRYFEITGPHKNPEVLVIHSDVPVRSSFLSDQAVLNWLYTATVRSLLSNMHGGVISDCPHRERLGYTGDGQLTCDTALMLLSADRLYEKWLLDIADGQDSLSGHIQHTAPFYGGGGGPGGWGCAIVSVPYFLWKHTGRQDAMEPYFPNMEKWISYMEAHSENGLVVREEEGGWCLGEWCTPEEVVLPAPFVNTYFFIKSLDRMAEMADAANRDGSLWRRKASHVRKAWRAAYYHKEENRFCSGVQGADAFALDIGLGNSEMAAALASKYDALGEFDTGIFGTEILLRVLFEWGYGDTAMRLLTSERPNSFGAQRRRGDTTLCERWNVRWASHNHHMFGACTGVLFRYLLGIRESADGLSVEPADVLFRGTEQGTLHTRFGFLSVKRVCTENTVSYSISADVAVSFRFRGNIHLIPSGEPMLFSFSLDGE